MEVDITSRLVNKPIIHNSKNPSKNSNDNSKSFLQELKEKIDNDSYYQKEIAEVLADRIVHDM